MYSELIEIKARGVVFSYAGYIVTDDKYLEKPVGSG